MRRLLALAMGLALALTVLGVAERAQRGRERGYFQLVDDLGYSLTPVPGDPRGWIEGTPVEPRHAGRLRVICVGDSVTYGQGVIPPEAWPARLEGLLDGVETYNFAVPGWDAEQVAALLETRIAAWEPDVVVWGAYANDIFRTAIVNAWSGDAVYVRQSVPAGAAILPARPGALLLRHSALFRKLQAARYARWRDANGSPDVAWLVDAVARMKRWSASSGIPVIALAIPPQALAGSCPPSRTPGMWICDAGRSWYDTLTRSLAMHGPPWVDGLEAWEGRGPLTLPGTTDPDHPNVEGHRLLAERVALAVRPLLDAR